MALRMFPQVPVMSPFPSSSKSGSVRLQPPCVSHHSLRPLSEKRKRRASSLLLTPINAVDESQANSETGSESVSAESKGEPAESQPGELSELGMEIKKAMEQRKKEEEKEGLFSGVVEEVREIEWPVFGKVLGTTGVVLGVIAGSSVVLLTVNAVLAELSDQVFAGKGIQDFFG